MRYYFIIISFFFCINNTNCQSDSVKQEILQKSIDLPELQKSFENHNKKRLIILETEYIRIQLKLTKFGKDVEMLPLESLFFEGLEADLYFTIFDYKDSLFKVQFMYAEDYKKIDIVFEKKNGTWSIKSSKIISVK